MASAPFSVQTVADGVFACVPNDGTANAGFIAGEDGVVVIDTLTTPSQAQWLISSIRQVTDAPIRYVVNTHWHGDHTFGNDQFDASGILAHVTCREDLLDGWDSTHALLARLYPPLAEQIEQVSMRLPDLTFNEAVTLHVGPLPVELRYLGRAHTRGDVLVLIPSEGILFAGDIAFHGFVPSMQDSYPSGWLEVIATAAGLDLGTVVPGHGQVGGKAVLRDMGDCLAQIVSETKRGFTEGLTPEATAAGIRMGRFSDWGRQADRLPVGVARIYQELRGEIS